MSRAASFGGGRPLQRLVASLFLFELGSAMTLVGLPLLVVDRYGLGLGAGLALGVRLLPNVVAGPFVGAFVDRANKRRVAIVSALASAGLVALIPATTSLGQVQLLAFLVGFTFMFGIPARLALRPLVMRPGDEVRGNSLIVTAERSASMLGPLVAGPVIAIGGISWVFFVEAATAAGAALVMLGLPLLSSAADASVPQRPNKRSTSVWRVLANTLAPLARMLARDGMLAGLTATAFSYVAAVGAGRILLTVLAASQFSAVAGMLGYMLAAMGAGGVIGGFAAGRLSRIHQGRLFLAGNLAEACCWIALPFVPSVAGALILLVAAGVFESVATVVYFAEAQARLETSHVGRYYATLIPLTDLAMMVGTICGAPLVLHAGVELAGGSIALLIAVPVLLLARVFLRERCGSPA